MSDHEEQGNDSGLLPLLAPYLAATALIAVLVTLLIIRMVWPANMAAAPEVVVFDVVKFTNAQRAVASRFLDRRGDATDASEILLNLSERTREAISDAAGPGVLVMVRQTVVQGEERDITDEVLRRLGLPGEVPTADATRYALDYAPTMMFRPPPERKPERLPGERLGGRAGEEILP